MVRAELKLGAFELQVQRSNPLGQAASRTLLRQKKIVLASETGKSAVSFPSYTSTTVSQ